VVEKALQDKLQIIARAEGEALSAKMVWKAATALLLTAPSDI
jgi:hypothetical protein